MTKRKPKKTELAEREASASPEVPHQDEREIEPVTPRSVVLCDEEETIG